MTLSEKDAGMEVVVVLNCPILTIIGKHTGPQDLRLVSLSGRADRQRLLPSHSASFAHNDKRVETFSQVHTSMPAIILHSFPMLTSRL